MISLVLGEFSEENTASKIIVESFRENNRNNIKNNFHSK